MKQAIFDEEENRRKPMRDLYEALGLLMALDDNFSDIKLERKKGYKIPIETSREYFTIKTFFKNQYEKKKESIPDLNIKAMAKSEKKRIKGVLNKVKKLIDESEYSQNDTYVRALNYIEYLNVKVKENEPEQEPVIEEKPMMKSKVCCIWCYAYYHFILETYIDKTKVFPYAYKIKIAKISENLYEIDGDQFYNEYHKLTKMRVLESIKNMNPKRREKLRESIIKLAKLYNSPSHIKWWDTTFIKTE